MATALPATGTPAPSARPCNRVSGYPSPNFGLRFGNLLPVGVKGEPAGGSASEIIRFAIFGEPALELVAGNGGNCGGSCQCPARFDEHFYHSLCFRHFVAIVEGDESGDIVRKSRNNAFTCARVADVIQASTTSENIRAN